MAIEPPPPLLRTGRVVSYAIVPDDVPFVQRNLLFVDWKPVGRMAALAIIERLGAAADVALLHCDEEWNTCGEVGNRSVAELKAYAERSYPGLAPHWVDVNTSREDALAYYDAEWPNSRCSFCGRRLIQVDELTQGRSSIICNYCKPEHEAELLQSAEVPAEPRYDFCSFCGKHMHSVQSMFESERAAICDVCVHDFSARLNDINRERS